MKTKTRIEPSEQYRRTLRRLNEAETCLATGNATLAVMAARTAIETAVLECFGRAAELNAFVTFIALEAGAKPQTLKRIRILRDGANLVVHGRRDGKEREARHMLRLFRAIACRWLRSRGVRLEMLDDQE